MKILSSVRELSSSNLVFLLEESKDIQKIREFLDDKSLIKLEELISKWENFMYDFFLGTFEIEKLIVVWYINTKREMYPFVCDSFRKTPENISVLPNNDKNIDILLDATVLAKYKFTKYITESKLPKYEIITENRQKVLEKMSTIENICLSRDFVNMPTCDKTPEKTLEYIQTLGLQNTNIRVLDYDDIKKLGLNLIEAVWRASEHKPKLIILERIVDKTLPTIWFVWKWVIFDTWGINIKPSNWLYDMKWDMWGSSQVIHTMRELDNKNLNVNIIAALPMVENSISNNAYRPSDIITAYNGKTVDIINTDAEWRLVLADAMSYISKNYKLDTILTTATLTWACMYALWFNYSAVMWNDRHIIDRLVDNSKTSQEKYMELPFSEYFNDSVKWDISDLKNLADWVFGGSSVWWAFLSHFCDNWESFVHLDIAWTSDRKDNYSIFTKWWTWVWVDSLSKLFMSL